MFTAPRVETHDGVRFVWYPAPSYRGNGFGRFFNMIWFAARVLLVRQSSLIEAPTVIVGSTVHPLAALSGLLLSWRWGLPFVFEVRDIWPQSLVDLGRLSEKHVATRILSWIEVVLLKKAREVITLLPSSEAYLVSRGATRGRVTYIPNGVDFEVLAYSPPEFKKPHELCLMYLGAHGEANFLQNILSAAKITQGDSAFKDFSIAFEFFGEGSEKSKLIALAEEYKLENVHFRPAVPKTEISRVAAKADGFILNLARADVFKYGVSPNKLFDYLALGRPVLFCCNSKFNPVNDADAGFSVAPESPEALAEAILELARLGNEERRAMGARGLDYVRKGHDVTMLARRLGEVLDRAVIGAKE
jgi:glycosyltransferase involved in cell wall biosynthesis